MKIIGTKEELWTVKHCLSDILCHECPYIDLCKNRYDLEACRKLWESQITLINSETGEDVSAFTY